MNRWNGKNAIVTGVNSEIGTAIAQRLLDDGVNVIGVDRRETKLKGVAKYYFKKCDTSNEDDVVDLFIWIADHIEGADVLINNSALFEKNRLLDGDKEAWSELVRSSILSYALVTKEFHRSLIDRDVEVSQIINIINFYGLRVPKDPSMSFYTATQHALYHYTEHLRQEFENSDSCIKVTSLCPRFEPLDGEWRGVSSKDVTDAVLYVLDVPSHVQVHDMVLEPFVE